MLVHRASLPGSVTVVSVSTPQMLVIDASLDRPSAHLAVSGLLPGVHPDVIGHWLDQVYERRHPFAVRKVTTASAAAMIAALALMGMHPGIHHQHMHIGHGLSAHAAARLTS